MTLTLTPENAEDLTVIAAQRGLSPDDALAQVLAEARAEFNDAVADVRASLEDFAAGRSVSLEEYRAEALERRRLRDSHAAVEAAA